MTVTQKEIVEALNEAGETVLDWGAYASEYFQEKHGLVLGAHKFSDLANRIQSEGIAPPNGWELVPSIEFHALWFWLNRCEYKGHLDNCYDLVQPLADFNKAMRTAAKESP